VNSADRHDVRRTALIFFVKLALRSKDSITLISLWNQKMKYSRMKLSNLPHGAITEVDRIFACPQSPTGQALVLQVRPYSISEFGSADTEPTHIEIWWSF
jgi:DNA-binding IclR family transcriptional regulator